MTSLTQSNPRRLALRRGCLALLVPVFAAALYLAVWARYRLEPTTWATKRLDRCAALILPWLRATLRDGEAPPPDGCSAPTLRLPVWVSLYRAGRLVARARSEQAQWSAAAGELARSLAVTQAVRALTRADWADLRIKLDLGVSAGRVVALPALVLAHSFVPGLDAVVLQVGSRRAYLLPDDQQRFALLAGYQPVSFMVELRSGLEVHGALNLLAAELQLTREDWRTLPHRWSRLRLRSYLDDPTRARIDLVARGRVPIDRISRQRVLSAARSASDYIVRQLRPDGRFQYVYDPLSDRFADDSGYNLTRHAGTTWFLVLAAQRFGDQRLAEAASRALGYLAAKGVPAPCRQGLACVGDADEVGLGASSLSLVALAEHEHATGDRQHARLLDRLIEAVLRAQRPNGDFCHVYRPRLRRYDCGPVRLYYSGEAALALAKAAAVRPARRPVIVAALRRALDYLVDEQYDYFLGQFLLGEDHWTCIAAEAAWPFVREARHLTFCRELAAFGRRAQLSAADPSLADLRGSFGVTPFVLPHNTPVGSRTEANVATARLARRWGQEDALLRRTVLEALRYLVDQQQRSSGGYLWPRPELALGGITQTPVRSEIRIDYVQHAGMALLRALPLVPSAAVTLR
ncbi:MAG: hypothetical protein IPL40_04955 [Proteobacteria bacterium]|nr:hypothetical protein [Pseudomonadota bacterium]